MAKMCSREYSGTCSKIHLFNRDPLLFLSIHLLNLILTLLDSNGKSMPSGRIAKLDPIKFLFGVLLAETQVKNFVCYSDVRKTLSDTFIREIS